MDIYQDTSILVWILFFLCVFGAITIVLSQLHDGHYRTSHFWVTGVIILIFLRIWVVLFPYIRGIYTLGGDNMTHLGLLKDIVMSGHTAEINFYPITHIFGSISVLITNSSIEAVTNYSTIPIALLYVISLYLIVRILFVDRVFAILCVTLVAAIIFDGNFLYFKPNGWTMMFLPFVFFVLLKNYFNQEKTGFKIILLLVLLIAPFFHPLAALILSISIIGIYATYLLADYTPDLFVIDIKNVLKNLKNVVSFPFLGILLVSWIIWLLSFRFFSYNIQHIYDVIISGSEIGEVPINEMTGKLQKIHVDISEIFKLTIKIYGTDIVFLVLFIIGVYILIKNFEKIKNFDLLYIFGSFTIAFGLTYFVFLFDILPLKFLAGERMISTTMLFTPIFAAVTLRCLIKDKKIFYIILCGCLIVIPILLSSFNTYQSPYTERPSNYITHMDISGMKWSLENNNPTFGYAAITSLPSRYTDTIYGTFERSQRLLNIGRAYVPFIPNHFNYDNTENLGSVYRDPRYLVICRLDRIVYTTVYKDVGRFDDKDFVRLEGDNTVNKLYNNGDTAVILIDAS
ncbi:MAG TPA: hypothetical protein HA272_04055 [Methanoregula sp.]|nr:hypothetical protein [Methanoregula sp.]